MWAKKPHIIFQLLFHDPVSEYIMCTNVIWIQPLLYSFSGGLSLYPHLISQPHLVHTFAVICTEAQIRFFFVVVCLVFFESLPNAGAFLLLL